MMRHDFEEILLKIDVDLVSYYSKFFQSSFLILTKIYSNQYFTEKKSHLVYSPKVLFFRRKKI